MTIPWKYSPYIFIAFLCLVIVIIGYVIIPYLPWYMYILGFVVRFIFLSAIWQLIRLVNKKLEKRFILEKQPGVQIILQVLVTLTLMSPVLILSFWAGRPYWSTVLNKLASVYDWVFPLTVLIIIFMLMMMTFGYYTYDLFIKYKTSAKEKARLELEAAKLEKEKTQMLYHHLKNQVNPHFLFNTLTSLDGLIQVNPELASDFVRHLSKVYRYVLEHKENEVVTLETEISFIRHYISLLKIRYKEAILIDIAVSEAGMEKGIAMVTLQMLIDNAIKHNMVQAGNPLHIRIYDQGDYFYVTNNKQLRKQIEPSNRQGLKQLQELYTFLSGTPVVINDNTGSFDVKLPLL